jgi:hypothetical protein
MKRDIMKRAKELYLERNQRTVLRKKMAFCVFGFLKDS